MLTTFRDNLKRYGQNKLLEYLETFYFNRVKEWASWYRNEMYGCPWLANTNMHVESWHNLLKSRIMERRSNIRVDRLMSILREAELIYFWKWSRARLGYVKDADPGWLLMRGDTPSADDLPSCQPIVVPVPIPIVEEAATPCKRESHVQAILEKIDQLKRLLETTKVPLSNQRKVLKQLSMACNVIQAAGEIVVTNARFVKAELGNEIILVRHVRHTYVTRTSYCCVT